MTLPTLSEFNYRNLWISHKREVSFATLLNFSCSYGQTFFISLLLPAMAAAAGHTLETAGFFYAIVTLLSALLLASSGFLADRYSPKTYASGCMVLIGLACLTASMIQGTVTLLLALLLLRFGGQGLLPHAANVAVAKRFKQDSAPAYAVSSLGMPLGEGIFPLLIAVLLTVVTVSQIWMILALAVFLLALPYVYWSGKAFDPTFAARLSESESAPTTFFNSRIWTDSRLWWLTPHIFSIPFVFTGILFYQSTLADETGWNIWQWATGLTLFAASRAIVSVGAGFLMSGRPALPQIPFITVPMMLGSLLLVWPGIGVWALHAFFVTTGISLGLATVVGKTALVEVYSTQNIGRAKAAVNAVIVLSTAAAPPAMSFFVKLAQGNWVTGILVGSALVMCLSTFYTFFGVHVLKKRIHGQSI
ncbi:MAG: MFS transporter [Verrucomicrobiota bacterium]